MEMNIRIKVLPLVLMAFVFSTEVLAESAGGDEPPLGINNLNATFKWRPNYVSDDMLIHADKDANNWLNYGKGYQGKRYSQLREINRKNVADLRSEWNLQFGVVGAQDSQVTAVNGTLYVTSSENKVFAVDGKSGRILWKYEHPLPADIGPYLCCEAVNRGVAVYRDKVYMATLDAQVVALDNWSGKLIWKKKLHDYTSGAIFTSAPLVVKGRIVVGNSGADVGGNAGYITALNADTGEQEWQFVTRPESNDHPVANTWKNDSWKNGGGSAWLTGTYDPVENIIYWGASNPAPDFDPHVREGDNLYTNSAIALDGDTGEYKFHFQYTPNDSWDYSGVNENILITDMKGREVWLHADRNGHLYNIDRKTGECNWVKPMVRVNWAKGFDKNCRPILNPEKRPQYGKLVKDIAPILDGGKEWHPATYSDRTNLIYIPFIDSSMNIEIKKQEFKRGKWWLASKTLQANPYTGGLKAFDATTGELIWTRPQSYPATSGLVSTAGGLVFSGNAAGYFEAVDDETGETLWRHNVGAGIHGNPTTFTVDGKQMVAIVYGPGGGSLWPLAYGEFMKVNNRGGGLMVFALPN